jgi:hypothetical protein
MILALAALAAGNLPMEAAAVFLISTQGALFGPSKYGLLPELLPGKQALLGKRRHRARHVSRVHYRGDVRGISGGRVSRPPDLVRRNSSRIHDDRPASRASAFRACLPPTPRGNFAQIHSPILAGNFASSRGIASSAGRWWATRICGFWPRCCNSSSSSTGTTCCTWTKRDQLLAGRGGNRHRGGSLAAGYLIARQNRIPPGSLGAMGMTVFGFLVSRHGLGIWPVRVDLCLLGFLAGSTRSLSTR